MIFALEFALGAACVLLVAVWAACAAAIIWSIPFVAYLWCRVIAGIPHEHISGVLWPLPRKWRDRIGAAIGP
jgi:hypothetical protein